MYFISSSISSSISSLPLSSFGKCISSHHQYRPPYRPCPYLVLENVFQSSISSLPESRPPSLPPLLEDRQLSTETLSSRSSSKSSLPGSAPALPSLVDTVFMRFTLARWFLNQSCTFLGSSLGNLCRYSHVLSSSQNLSIMKADGCVSSRNHFSSLGISVSGSMNTRVRRLRGSEPDIWPRA
ncbi:hypothetical protein EGW08_003229, partial [Elysia chlorotica]